MSVETLDATVLATYELTHRVKQLVLRVDGHTFAHRPGQHVSVRYGGDSDTPVYRPYSPVNRPGTDTLILAVKRYEQGTCSVWLHERSEGDVVSLLPPSGGLRLHALERDVAFIATGTGLTPLLAMLYQYVDEGSGRAALLFGERTQADLIYRPILDALSASHAQLSVEYVLSDEAWPGRTGYVQEHLEGALASLDEPHIYVCGVPEMVVDTRTVLEKRGVSADRIVTEGWEEGAVEN